LINFENGFWTHWYCLLSPLIAYICKYLFSSSPSQIVDNCSKLMDNIHEAINQDRNVPLQAAALQCILSLSRSVQQLRTTFQDVKIWQPVITALQTSVSDDIISVSSSVLC